MDTTENTYESIHLALRFYLGTTASVDEIVPKLPKPPNDIWKQFRIEKSSGFSYTKKFQDRFVEEKEVTDWLGSMVEIWDDIAEVVDPETTCELSIAIYVKDNSGINLPFDVILQLEAFGCSLDIDVFNVR